MKLLFEGASNINTIDSKTYVAVTAYNFIALLSWLKLYFVV